VPFGTVKGVWFNPADADQSCVLLYFHGGGFVVGSPMTAASIAGTLADRAKLRCFSLDYPLAPEAPYPAAHDNAVDAYVMLLDSGYAAENIVLAGDSAGGNIALGTLLRIRDRGLPMPAGAYLLSPWADLGNSLPTQELKRDVDPILAIADLNMMTVAYASNRDLKDPLLSPIFADLRGLPPLLIQVGSHEILLDDSLTVARNAALADVPVTLKVWPGYNHVFQMWQSVLEGSRKALGEGVKFCDDVLTKTYLKE
jgi:acetyl esterase/lipase